MTRLYREVPCRQQSDRSMTIGLLVVGLITVGAGIAGHFDRRAGCRGNPTAVTTRLTRLTLSLTAPAVYPTWSEAHPRELCPIHRLQIDVSLHVADPPDACDDLETWSPTHACEVSCRAPSPPE